MSSKNRVLELLENIPGGDATADLTVKEAQVYATLYLAEQQRVNNLILLAAHMPGEGGAYWRGIISHPVDGYALELNDDIKETLEL